MFKLKPGNVFQKLNNMDKKQAYTWGAIVVVCFIALITLASFMGDAEDASFEGYSTRGYDLAQMPFVNDEAEEYLLASKYPDMKNNGSTMLYSQAEKEARQEADAQAAQEAGEAGQGASSEATVSTSSRGYSGRGYSGGRRGGTGTPTQVGQLGSASMGHAGGSGMSGTYGAPRGDFSPYKSQDKGSEIQTQLKNTDARRALAQFAQTSRAAAGLKDNKNANAKRALMGGSIRGSEAFTDSGVDLSKAGGLGLDTNAPVSSADLSNLDKKVGEGQKKAEDKRKEENQDLSDKLLEQFLTGLVNLGMQALGGLIDKGINAAFGEIEAYGERNAFDNDAAVTMLGKTNTEIKGMPAQQQKSYQLAMGMNDTEWNAFLNSDTPQTVRDGFSGQQKDFVNNMKKNKNEIITSSYQDDNGETQFITLGSMHTSINHAYRGGSGQSFVDTRQTNTNAGSRGQSNSGSGVSGILNNTSMTQTEKVDKLVGQGLSKEAACQQVYKTPNC